MGKALRADGAVGDAYASFDLGSDQPIVWLTFDLAADTAAVAFWAADASNSFGSLVDPFDSSAWGVYLNAGVWSEAAGSGETGASPPLVAETWLTCELGYDSVDPSFPAFFYVDGSLVFSATAWAGVAIRKIAVGLAPPSTGTLDPAAVALIRNVKAGTTRGGNDLFEWLDTETDLSAWTDTTGDVTLVDDPYAASAPSLTMKLYDLSSNELADITPIALEKTLHRRYNAVRGFTVVAPSGHSLLTAVADDGYPNLWDMNRKLLVWENGDIIFHGRIFKVERVGDGTRNRVTISAFMPWMELGFDADDRAGRPVRDETGNFISPTFTSSVGGQDEISGPDLIKQILTNSQQTGDETDPNPGEGPLPIDLTDGTWDLTVPPAIDLTPNDTMDWPILIGDFIAMLVATGVVDVDERPVDPSEGFDDYVMSSWSAVSSMGTDRSGTVHFDYWTGSKNAAACRHVQDGTPLNNKLYDYIGPRLNKTQWPGNITPGSPGTTVDPTASRARYGTFMSIRVLDFNVDSDSPLSGQPFYPLALALWNAEQGYRVEPRDLLSITPAAGSKALFDAPGDFDVGDLIAINVGAPFGLELAEAQRVYGYDKTWSREGVPRLSQLLTSADLA